MRVLFLGTPEFSVPTLMAIGESPHALVGVVTQPDRQKGRGLKAAAPPVKVAAQALGIELYQPEGGKGFQARLRDIIAKTDPDIAVVVAYGQIIGSKALDQTEYGFVNLHASLLPELRGAAPIHWAVIRGYEETGVTTMHVTPELDAGDIILTRRIDIGQGDTAGSVHDCLAKLGATLMVKTLDMLEGGTAPRLPQNDADATWAPKLTSNDEIICWTAGSRDVFNQVRGLYPWPRATTYWQGAAIKVNAVSLVNQADLGEVGLDYPPGSIVALKKGLGPVVKCGQGHVLVAEVQPAGSRIISGADFLNGYNPTEGDQFAAGGS